jgi:hypothetical protein
VIFSFATLKHRWLLSGVWVVINVNVEEKFWWKLRPQTAFSRINSNGTKQGWLDELDQGRV